MAKVEFTDAQRAVIDARNANLLVSAAAGSGKTAVLTERICRRVTDRTDPADIDELLIMTFTRAAAAGSVPKLAPPPWTLGQEMFTSSQPTWGHSSSRRQTSTYSSTEKPLTLAITGL